LVANRGEIAVRVMRTLADLGIESVVAHPDDDAGSLHVRRADAAVVLPGVGPAAYLDIEAVVDAARRSGCQAVHPGYGFLAENAAFATVVEAAGLTFIGPRPDTLALFGDKVAARRHAQAVGVPVARGAGLPDGDAPAGVAAAVDAAMGLLAELGPDAALMIKAAAGGGGRGMRIVAPGSADDAAGTDTADLLAEAVARCASEARSAFGDGALYAEELLLGARHIEVQVIGDGTDVAALGERECSIQRQRQKLVEMAPAPGLHPEVRARLVRHALDLVAPIGLRSLATMEFLVTGAHTADATIVFCEGNARIQVEHTVTEEVLGIDLVEAQIRLADGAHLADLDLPDAPTGIAVQARLNLERLDADGSVRPAGGTLDPLVFPTGPGIRVDTGIAPGDTTNPRYDTLAAKIIAHHRSDDPRRALARLAAALAETSTGAVDSTAALIGAIVVRDEVATGQVHTRWLDDHLADLVAGLVADHPASDDGVAPVPAGRLAGATVDRSDPLAVLAHGRDAALAPGVGEGALGPQASPSVVPGDGVVTASAPLQGTVVSIAVEVGDVVAAGTTVAVMEAMKMEHVVVAPEPGTVTAILVEASCRTTTPSWPAPRATRTTARRTASSSSPSGSACRSCSSPRAAVAAPATPTAPASPASTASPSTSSAELSGLVPLVGIASGAASPATPPARLLRRGHRHRTLEHRHGRPGHDRGRRPRRVPPEEIGPIEVQIANGVVDVAVEDEAEAVAVAKQYLSYFQGTLGDWDCADQRLLRHAIPENRLRVYDVRGRHRHARRHRLGARAAARLRLGMVTALARIEGRPSGSSPTTPRTSPARSTPTPPTRPPGSCSCATRSTCPSVPVRHARDHGRPRRRATALVRHASRMFVTAGSVTVPTCTIVLRKGYGLGAQAMAGGQLHAPLFGGLAHRRVRRHGPRGRGEARLPQGARGEIEDPRDDAGAERGVGQQQRRARLGQALGAQPQARRQDHRRTDRQQDVGQSGPGEVAAGAARESGQLDAARSQPGEEREQGDAEPAQQRHGGEPTTGAGIQRPHPCGGFGRRGRQQPDLRDERRREVPGHDGPAGAGGEHRQPSDHEADQVQDRGDAEPDGQLLDTETRQHLVAPRQTHQRQRHEQNTEDHRDDPETGAARGGEHAFVAAAAFGPGGDQHEQQVERCHQQMDQCEHTPEIHFPSSRSPPR
jgi:acetyl/propionyl-CoA carboxylase alpha subunit